MTQDAGLRDMVGQTESVVDGNVGWIYLDNPARLNAISLAMQTSVPLDC